MGPEGTNLIESVFAGRGEMAARMRALDWSTTALGPVEQWQHALRTSLRIVLGCGYAMAIFWGPDFTCPVQRCLHTVNRNKASVGAGSRTVASYIPRHGISLKRCLTKSVREQKASFLADQPAQLTDSNYLEDCYFTMFD